MQKAHEDTNVITVCTNDSSLQNILSHMLEQLELCQKSLSGYYFSIIFFFLVIELLVV